MIELSLRDILRSADGRWTGEENLLELHPENVVTDSRQAGPGSLFIAFRGERTDGHKYIPDVLKKGALAVLCEEPGQDSEPRIIVPEVMTALRSIAAYNRARCRYPFIGVTGSVGKTTAKEMIAAALSGRYRTFKTPGSMNGQIGIPVTMMSLASDYEAAVVEMGISLFGEMTRITKVVQPDYAVFTNIGDAHLEALHDRNGVLKAKSEILLGMKPEAVIFANGDDELLSEANFQRRKVLFGLGKNCDVRAEDVKNEDGSALSCTIVCRERRIPVWVPAYGDYVIYSILAAAAVAVELGLSDEEIREGLKSYRTVGHRSRIVKTPLCTLIDDCYNANPTSNAAAIDSMMKLPGRKVCILGDMREMGERSHELHRQIGEYAVERGVDLIVTQGEDARYISRAAGKQGMDFPDRDSLLRALPAIIRQGDVVLVKASHSAAYENVAEAIEKLQ